MKVVLLQNVKGIGQKGQIKEVKEGYAQNHLIPRHLAKPATETVLREMEKLARDGQVHDNIIHQKIKENLDRIQDKHFTLVLSANDQGALFAKFDEKNLLSFLREHGYDTLTIKHLRLSESPIKKIGSYQIFVREGKYEVSCTLEIQAQ